MTNNLKHIIMPDGTKLDLPTGSGGGSAKIGDIGFAPYVDETTNERRRLNGQVLIKDQYPAFVTWLTGLQATTPSLFATEDEWQAIKTASKLGQCGKFVIGDTTIRLPQIVNINGLVDMSNAGLIKDESLPNIKSHIEGIRGTDNLQSSPDSALYWKKQNYPKKMSEIDGTASADIAIDLSRNNSTYQDNAPVQQEAIQYPYYITVNTGSQTIEPTINDYTVTTAYQYGMSQYYKGIMNSGAWLRSNRQMNPKATYEGLYNWALTQLNAGVEGFKGSTTSDITDYDFVINQTDETFRLPLKNGLETLIDYTKGVDITGYTTSTNQFKAPCRGIILLAGNASEYGYINNQRFSTRQSASDIYVNNQTIFLNSGDTYYGNYESAGVNALDNKFFPYVGDGNLYYYCGNVEENLQNVNVARIEEALVDKTSMAQASIASIPSDKYEDLTLLASEQPYTAPENGYFYLSKAGSNGQYISILNPSTGISLFSEKNSSSSSPRVLYRVKKGDEIIIIYTTTGTTNYFRFYYDIGASSVSPDKAIANHLDTINGEVV